jgi:hypothetical protein
VRVLALARARDDQHRAGAIGHPGRLLGCQALEQRGLDLRLRSYRRAVSCARGACDMFWPHAIVDTAPTHGVDPGEPFVASASPASRRIRIDCERGVGCAKPATTQPI